MKIRQLLTSALASLGESGPCQWSERSGGDTSISVEIAANGRKMFAKIHDNPDLLACEAKGLSALSRFATTPRVLFHGQIDGHGVVVMEWLALHRPGSEQDWQRMGEALAALHSGSLGRNDFGFSHDNYIGGNVQNNGWLSDWPEFFVARRLAPQLALACGLPQDTTAGVQEVMDRIHELLPCQPVSALVHGDLWTGNLGLHNGEPVFFDPACYYGDPQVDLAMMALFGSVPDNFYLAYQGRMPNAEERRAWRVYDLYHLLNHFNLFGSGYAASVARVTEQLLQD